MVESRTDSNLAAAAAQLDEADQIEADAKI